MIFLLNQKPDTSLAQKSGHFYLLTTLTIWRLSIWRQSNRNPQRRTDRTITERHSLFTPAGAN